VERNDHNRICLEQ